MKILLGIGAVVLVLGGGWFFLRGNSQDAKDQAWLEANKTCLSSHGEQYIERSPSVVVGVGKYGGGVAVPIGDDAIKTRTICDSYYYPPLPRYSN